MICQYCGKENPDDTERCGFCGAPLLVNEAQSAVESAPSEPATSGYPSSVEIQENQAAIDQTPAPASGSIYGNKIWWMVGCLVLLFFIFVCVALGAGLYRFTKVLGFLNPTTVTPIPPFSLVVTVPALPSPAPMMTITAEITPNPTSQKLVESTTTPHLSTPGMLFFDDFSDPNSGWNQVEETEYSTYYFENSYRIVVNSAMSDSWSNPGEQVFSDVLIDVDATKYGGPDDNDFGLICRYGGIDRYYFAVISSDGYYGISKVTNKTTEILGRDHLDYSDTIAQGFTSNHVRFECVGNLLTLYVNGQLLDQQSDGTYNSGNVGLIAGTYTTPGTDILFDNFSVYSP